MKVKIDSNNKSITFSLNKNFYPLEEVLKTAQAFSEICWVNVEEDKDKFNVALTPKSDDTEVNNLKHEFCNYALGIIKTKSS
jgi:hypothetical protein